MRIVTSQRSGMGKSLFIKRMAQKHASKKKDVMQCNTLLHSIPLHGPLVTADTLMECLKDHLGIVSTIFHFDIASDVCIYDICYISLIRFHILGCVAGGHNFVLTSSFKKYY